VKALTIGVVRPDPSAARYRADGHVSMENDLREHVNGLMNGDRHAHSRGRTVQEG
jgi:hypothetical protein